MCDSTCLHHAPDTTPNSAALNRRSLLRTGALVVSTAPLVTFAGAARASAAAEGSTQTQTWSGHFDQTAPDWHYLPFVMPAGVKEIKVSYTTGKSDTGLGFSLNVIDLGIFDPSGHELGNGAGFRGWSGGARNSFSISRTSATPGYRAGELTEGTWNLILGPVAQVTGSDWSVTLTLVFGEPGPRFKPSIAPRSVAGTGPRWYRGDQHCHTIHSDGRWTQSELVAAAKAAGLDYIVSTEHNTNSAHLTWGDAVPDDFLVIMGEEITTRAGHWIAAGIPAGSWIDWRFRPEDGELQRFTDQVRGLGGMAITAHPMVPIPSTKWDFGYDYAGIDAVEIWNGPWTQDDQAAVDHWHALLVQGHWIPVVGSSDSHHSGQTVGLSQTCVRAASLSTGDILDGLKGGHSYLTESSAISMDLQASYAAPGGRRTAEAGDQLGAPLAGLVDVTLTVSGAPGCIVQVRDAAAVVAGVLIDESGTATMQATVAKAPGSFVRAEVRRPDGSGPTNPLGDTALQQMVALSNPIWL